MTEPSNISQADNASNKVVLLNNIGRQSQIEREISSACPQMNRKAQKELRDSSKVSQSQGFFSSENRMMFETRGGNNDENNPLRKYGMQLLYRQHRSSHNQSYAQGGLNLLAPKSKNTQTNEQHQQHEKPYEAKDQHFPLNQDSENNGFLNHAIDDQQLDCEVIPKEDLNHRRCFSNEEPKIASKTQINTNNVNSHSPFKIKYQKLRMNQNLSSQLQNIKSNMPNSSKRYVLENEVIHQAIRQQQIITGQKQYKLKIKASRNQKNISNLFSSPIHQKDRSQVNSQFKNLIILPSKVNSFQSSMNNSQLMTPNLLSANTSLRQSLQNRMGNLLSIDTRNKQIINVQMCHPPDNKSNVEIESLNKESSRFQLNRQHTNNINYSINEFKIFKEDQPLVKVGHQSEGFSDHDISSFNLGKGTTDHTKVSLYKKRILHKFQITSSNQARAMYSAQKETLTNRSNDNFKIEGSPMPIMKDPLSAGVRPSYNTNLKLFIVDQCQGKAIYDNDTKEAKLIQDQIDGFSSQVSSRLQLVNKRGVLLSKEERLVSTNNDEANNGEEEDTLDEIINTNLRRSKYY